MTDGPRPKELLDPEAMALATVEQISREGWLNCKGTPPCHTIHDLVNIQLVIQGTVFQAMKRMREACAAKIEEGVARIPESMPSFIAAQAEGAIRTLADVIRSIHIHSSAGPLPVQYAEIPTIKDIDNAVSEASKNWIKEADRRAKQVETSFECQWCMEAGLTKEEYTKQGIPPSADFYGRPLCRECLDRCEPPPKKA